MLGNGTRFRGLIVALLFVAVLGLAFALPGLAAPIAGLELVAPSIVLDGPVDISMDMAPDIVQVAPITGFTGAEAWHLLCLGFTVRQAHWPPGLYWWMATRGGLAYCTFTMATDGGSGVFGLGFVLADLRIADGQHDWLVVTEEVVADGK